MQAPTPPSASRTAAAAVSRRWLRWTLRLGAALLLSLCALLAAAWWWSGQADSLRRTLDYVARWLPEGQSLETRDVQGSLRHGGSLQWLRWSSPTLDVEVEAAELAWSLPSLWEHTLHFDRIQLQALRLRSTPGPKEDTPTQALQSLQLPLRLHVPLQIATLEWQGTPAITLHQLDARYDYDGQQHRLQLQQLRYAQGVYTGQVELQAAAPMQLAATLQGQLQAELPHLPEAPLHIQAKVAAHGTLATEAARLAVQAQAQTTGAEAPSPQGLSLDAQAQVRPWLPQPLEQLQAQMQHVDVALFWPEGPRTDLQGSITAQTQDTDWQLQADIRNAIPAPWDQQGLPIHHVQAEAHFNGLDTWRLAPLHIQLDAANQSFVQAQGQFNTATQSFEGEATLHALRPQLLYSTLDSTPLSGKLEAHHNSQQDVAFQLQLQSPDRQTAAQASGTWKAPQLQLRDLQLNALQAQLHSPQLDFNSETLHLQGQLHAAAPGLQAAFTANASPSTGQGQLELELKQAQQFLSWLNQLPVPGAPRIDADLQGSAHAQLRWQGGWQGLQQRLLAHSVPSPQEEMQLQLQLDTPQLAYRPAAGSTADAITLQNMQFTLAGTAQALRGDLRASATVGTQQMQLDTTLSAGLKPPTQSQAMDWYAEIAQLQAQWKPDAQAAQPWRLDLAAPLRIQSTTQPRATQIQASAGRISVKPPTQVDTQTASLVWEPIVLRHDLHGSWGIQSKGQLQGLPVVWVDAFNPHRPPLATLGISGDLVIQGRWDVDNTQKQLRAHAVIERASGDIRLTVEDPDAANVTIVRSSGASVRNATTHQVQSQAINVRPGRRTGMEDLRLEFTAQGEQVQAQFLWATQRAGTVKAQVSSQLQRSRTGWEWGSKAPLSGTIQASVPDIGLWAFLAPPGWRVGGTLDAQMRLSGTRQAPDWNGTISADQLYVQSILDGVDLHNGRMRAQLRDTRLDITEIAFTGGEGSSTRILGPSGNLTSAPQSGGSLQGSGFVEYDPQAPAGSSGIRMDIRTTLDHLQVLVRADRQISVSGQLQATLNDGQLNLGGNLTIDRATIILADSSAPTLGEDVHITSAASRQAQQQRAAEQAAKAQGQVQASRPPKIHVILNLGDDFALQGYGITTRLQGELTIDAGPRITGTIDTVNGRYRAWGQSLDVEKGTIRFHGPYDNPSIDIVAIRPNIDIRAGVKVTGSASRPRVTLISEPEMSDAEKLSWILMGRSAASGGAETALLQQAALALLSGGGGGGDFAGMFGLDEVGFKGPSADGEEGAALTFGKRLSKDLYIAYEQSLSGAMGTLYIFYDLSRRLTLRGQTGEQSAVDLIYTRTSD